MDLYESIDLARKFQGAPGVQESGDVQREERTMAVSLSVMEHLAAAKPEDPKPVQLGAMPLPN